MEEIVEIMDLTRTSIVNYRTMTSNNKPLMLALSSSSQRHASQTIKTIKAVTQKERLNTKSNGVAGR